MQIHPLTEDPGTPPTSAPRVTQQRLISTSISNTDGGSQTSSRNVLGKTWLKITYQLMKPNSLDRERPGGFVTSPHWAPDPPSLSWASLTRNGQLLDLKLQVDRGVLIWFGSSGLETHGSLQTWELLGIYFSYIPSQHLQREKKEGSYGGNCIWDAWAQRPGSLCSYDLLGVSQKRMLLVTVNYLGALNHIPLVKLAFPQDRKEYCRAPAVLNTGNLSPLSILLPWWLGQTCVYPETAWGSCSGRLWASGWRQSPPLWSSPWSA